MLTTIFAGLFMIGLLVVVHELGHALVARFFGVEVPVFSVGMGPRLFGIKWRGTDWRVSALPVGGYVQMAGADMFGEEDVSAEVDPLRSFMNKPVWQRLIIVAAGPVFNLILPVLVFGGPREMFTTPEFEVIKQKIRGSQTKEEGSLCKKDSKGLVCKVSLQSRIGDNRRRRFYYQLD